MASLARHALSLMILTASLTVAAQGISDPGYMTAIRQEIARLNINAVCDDRAGTCVFPTTLGEQGPTLDVTIRISSATHTVYIYIERFMEIGTPEGPGLELARLLLACNRQMVTSKLEWDESTATIRISVVLNTDSNFDRKAFRSQLLGMLSNARRIRPALVEAMKNNP